MREHERISHYLAPLTQGEPGSFNLMDDAAVLTPPAGKKLVITTDSVIENIHVLEDATPAQYAQKLLRRNLSDLAAMGATPWRYTLNLHTHPHIEESWFAEFAAALAREQTRYGVTLVGGDSTSSEGPIHLGLTCFGLIDDKPLLRSGAQAGDDIYVSGTLGDAALALRLLLHHEPGPSELFDHYHMPNPRVSLGKALHGVATAAVDISDGLVADLNHICAASHVGAVVMQPKIPLSPIFKQYLEQDASLCQLPLYGGDDYELCFTAPPIQAEAIKAIAKKLDLKLTAIGTITKGHLLQLSDGKGQVLPIAIKGWDYGD